MGLQSARLFIIIGGRLQKLEIDEALLHNHKICKLVFEFSDTTSNFFILDLFVIKLHYIILLSVNFCLYVLLVVYFVYKFCLFLELFTTLIDKLDMTN